MMTVPSSKEVDELLLAIVSACLDSKPFESGAACDAVRLIFEKLRGDVQ